MSNKQDLHGATLRIGDSLVIDSGANLTVQDMAARGNLTVQDLTTNGVLYADQLDERTTAHGVCFAANVCIDSGNVLKIDGLQVVGPQQPALTNLNTSASGPTIVAKVNSILDVLRNHGLIAQSIP